MSVQDASAAGDLPEMPSPRVREFAAHSIGGGAALLLGLVGLALGACLIALGANLGSGSGAALIVAGVLLAISALIAMAGLNTVAPGEARVVQLFGRYRGTIRQDGLRWVNPFTSRTKISTRVRNNETAVLKVNDAYGNPIELAAVVVWRVEDTAQATFEVDDYLEFVSTQTETAVRHIAIEYPYDATRRTGSHCGATRRRSPRSSPGAAGAVEAAGCGSSSRASRISRSAGDRLRDAPAAAGRSGGRRAAADRRRRGRMVEAALARIAEQDIVELDEERKAAMVSNLMVVLCGDRAPQPVLNTGSLYQ